MTRQLPQAMAFFDTNYRRALQFASRYAGPTGRLATLPDIVDARLATDSTQAPWNHYVTTNSSEFLGLSRDGVPLLVVAHGIGPMSTPESIIRAYEYGQSTNCSNHPHGIGKITQEEFLRLINGDYGSVEIIELQKILDLYRYPFIEFTPHGIACDDDPLIRARLGNQYREFLYYHFLISSSWVKAHKVNPWGEVFYIHNSDANNCSYNLWDWLANNIKILPIGHLLVMEQLVVMNWSQGKKSLMSLVTEIDCHERSNAARFVAIRDQEPLLDFSTRLDTITPTNPEVITQLLRPSDRVDRRKFYFVMQVGNDWYTMHPIDGKAMQSWQPKFRVNSIQPVGDPQAFKTHVEGYHMFVRVNRRALSRIAPPNANACFIGECKLITENGRQKHQMEVTFYHVEVDKTLAIPNRAEIDNDYDLKLSLV